MSKFFDSSRSMFARTQLCLHALALGFHPMNNLLNPFLQVFHSSSSSHSSVLKVHNKTLQQQKWSRSEWYRNKARPLTLLGYFIYVEGKISTEVTLWKYYINAVYLSIASFCYQKILGQNCRKIHFGGWNYCKCFLKNWIQGKCIHFVNFIAIRV